MLSISHMGGRWSILFPFWALACNNKLAWAQVFVYRGRGFERLPEFQSRILDQFPTAELMTKLSAPTEEEMDQPGQMVQINKVQR